jgi:SAM-dependent methyltransferase
MRTPFQDAALYDWEYRRRRDDVRFYRALAGECGGPIFDLACGTGRLLGPLARDGHQVVGLDREPAMLVRAAARVARLPAAARRRALLVRGDLGALPLDTRGRLAVAAFHSVQHLETDAELAGFFTGVARCLLPGGWLAFDTFAPSPAFVARSPRTRWGQTRFRHPITKQLTLYSESHRVDGPVLDMTFHYQPIDARGRSRGRARRVRLRHRLLDVAEIREHLAAAGLSVIGAWGGFDGQPLDADTEQRVFLARRASVGEPK